MKYKNLQKQLYQWYNDHHRSLPWRETKNPYKIWVSEIILQQTRISQGLDYYNRFIAAFPTVEALANASEDVVLKQWQGLGYYSRARNLHFTAKSIVNSDKNFPTTYKDLLELKGVGEYTASAIASFAYDLPYAVVDGNVFRVIARLFDWDDDISLSGTKKKFTVLANELLDKKQPALHNNAMMELGALQCVGQTPECEKCPVTEFCQSQKNHTVAQRPVSTKKIAVKQRYFHFFLIRNDTHLLIEKRQQNDIWKGLYQLPMIEAKVADKQKMKKLFMDKLHIAQQSFIKQTTKKHLLTHQQLHIAFWEVFVPQTSHPDYISIPMDNINHYAFPKPISEWLNSVC